MLMLWAAVALGLLVGGAGPAAADCASEAKMAMEKRTGQGGAACENS